MTGKGGRGKLRPVHDLSFASLEKKNWKVVGLDTNVAVKYTDLF